MEWIRSYNSVRRCRCKLLVTFGSTPPCDPGCNPPEKQVDNRCREKRQHLTDQQSADNANAQWLSQFRSNSASEGERYGAEQRGHRGHHDRTKAQETRLVDRFLRRFILFALCFQRKVNHHDGVLL